jgi:diguanylate cyclase (GGDEF)-like protein/PAS domain S-box-containing protein
MVIQANDILIRKKLSASKAELRKFMDSASDIFIIYDSNLNLIDINKSGLKFLGVKKKDIIGKNIIEVNPDIKETGKLKKIFEVLDTGKKFTLPDYIRIPALGDRYVVSKIFKVGNGIGIASSDITEQKKIEEMLIAEKELAKKYLDIAGVIVVILGKNGRVSLVNKKGCEILEYSKEEIIGKDWCKNFLPKNAKKETKSVIKDLFSGQIKTPHFHENTILTKSGKERIISWHNTVIKDEIGNITATLSSGEDITDRKIAEDKLLWELKVNSALAKLSHKLSSTKYSIEDINELVLEQSKALAESKYGFVNSIDPDTGKFISHSTLKMSGKECRVKARDKSLNLVKGPDDNYPSLWGYCLNTKKAFYTNSPESHESHTVLPKGHIKIYNFLSTPVMIGDKIIGQISLANKKDGYDDKEIEAMKRIAGLYALSIQRKFSDIKIKESETKYRLLVENQIDLINKLDTEGNFIFVSPSYCEFYGRTEKELLGRNFIHFVHRKDKNSARRAIGDLKFPPYKSYSEQRVITKKGIKWVGWSNKAALDKNGKIESIVGVGRDITEKKLMEQKLIADEKRFRLLAENATDIVFRFRMKPKASFEYMSPSIIRIAGYLPKDFYEENNLMFKIVYPEDRPILNKIINNEINFKKPFELRWIAKNGNIIWTEQNLSPIYNNDGILEAIEGIARDITERKKSEEKIKYLSFHDSLTDLYNRAYFEEELKRLDTTRQLPLSFIMGDVNSLKLINDTFGHIDGDDLLKNIANLMRSFCRKEDIIARWGGDEFAILLPRTPGDYAKEIVERIREICKKTSRNKIPISVSVGVATKENESQDMQTIIREAENNMYKSKLLGKKSISSSVIASLTVTLFEKSYETEKHVDRLRELAMKMGKTLKLPQVELDNLSLLSTLHDIGKIAISEEILLKKEKLTEGEWEIIKRHPEIGFNICESSPQLAHIADIVLSHHEHFDGSGYPQGLKGGGIPIASRIIAILDAYDVMTGGRPYREPLSKSEAMSEIKKYAGSQFDPYLVEKFIEIISSSGNSN